MNGRGFGGLSAGGSLLRFRSSVLALFRERRRFDAFFS
jgi:hypothetical protein